MSKTYGRISFNIADKLACNQHSFTYRGKLDGVKKVVIKRTIVERQPEVAKHRLNNTPADREEEALRQLDHPNVRKLFHVEEEYPMRFFALDVYDVSLYEYCYSGKCTGPMPPDAVVLLHIVRGLLYIHSKGFAHRNIEPNNILISKTLPVTVMLSDFGLSKPVNSVTGSYSISEDRQIGSDTQLCWMAPELMHQPEDGYEDEGISVTRGSIASDTFSAGCVFFFYLTPSWHPFGDGVCSTKTNILDGKPVFLKDFPEEQNRFKSMIEAMISNRPESRTGLELVERDLQEMIGPYLGEPEPEQVQIPDDEARRPDWMM